MNTPTVRLAQPADLPTINEIYNYYVIHSTATYQTIPSTPDERAAWFADHDAEHPVTVVEQDGQIIGWGSLSRFHPRAAYRPTVEDSVYIRHDQLGKGLGTLILQDLIQRADQFGYHSIIAGISADQTPSVRLHQRYGFVTVGHLKEVGRKFDRWLDVIYMQMTLTAP